MNDELGKCYILRLKNVVSRARVELPMTGYPDKTSITTSPDDPGSYTLFEVLDVNMRHVGWEWAKEEIHTDSMIKV